MTLDASIGGVNSNSYATIEEADAYFATRFNSSTWTSSNNSNKEIALIEATRLLDTLVSWKGYVKSDSQSLKWPRTFVPTVDSQYSRIDTVLSSYISDSIIPKDVKNATYELAINLLTNNGYVSDENDLTKLKVGPITLDFSDTVKLNGLPIIVRDMIKNWGYYNNSSSNSVQVTNLVRT